VQCSASSARACPSVSCDYVLAACHTHSILHHLLIPRGVEEERVKERRHLSARPYTHAPFPLTGCVMHLTARLLMLADASSWHLRGLHERQRRITVGLCARDTSSAHLMPSAALAFPTHAIVFHESEAVLLQPRGMCVCVPSRV
jgi:hypothetical protein